MIDQDGSQIGIMKTSEALKKAYDAGLDLIEIAPVADPPVAKITDFGKFRYRQEKQERLHKAKQKKHETKGVRISFRTSGHDLEFKKKQVEKFLSEGNRVKIELILKGREKSMRTMAEEKLGNFLDSVAQSHKIIQDVKKAHLGLTVTITPTQ